MKSFSAFASLPGRLLLGSAAALSLLACDPSNDPTPGPPPVVTNSVFVINEGNYGSANADISLFSKASGTVTSKALYASANGKALGDVAQSMVVRDSLGYIVLNNSNKLEVVSLAKFSSKARIENLKFPRYFAAASSDKGYVTETVAYGSNGQVSVIDLKSNKVLKQIAVGVQPEKLAVVGARLYVTNNGSNTVTVINTGTDVVEGTITVGDGPNSIVADRNGRVWVLSSGKIVYTPTTATRLSKGSLSQIVPGQLTATTREMPSDQSSPGNLTINGSLDQLYYTYQGGVYTLGLTEATLPTKPLIRRDFYGLGVDPQDGTIYGGLASFTADDKVIRYRTTGAAIDSFTVGIGPNGFVFY
ncbi:DUF5074 domain-containing protein [Hymenobacter psychrophilus]|uniref:40-residue YVTN family beta-propeller repeat-containing protein n=1 Tax=Hymenobacter psychrophilus TaxID=651662 RepID=A0A1H3EKG0_9BACT|nr:DUF5074 domain-containing protein [Hymenobacter psychrophilus]SDX79263.1 40-residue YVTN family beta-propeller repeat-containing protein [Hymenobacter psychrophilus]